MPVTLSNRSAAIALTITIVAVVAAGIFHDQSIKAVYESFGSQIARDATLQNKVQQLQGLTKVTLVQGNISNVGGNPLYILFDPQFFSLQRGPSLTSAITLNTGSYRYQYQVYLGTGVTYEVRIYYSTTLSGTQSCAGVPVILTPTGSAYSQDFKC